MKYVLIGGVAAGRVPRPGYGGWTNTLRSCSWSVARRFRMRIADCRIMSAA